MIKLPRKTYNITKAGSPVLVSSKMRTNRVVSNMIGSHPLNTF